MKGKRIVAAAVVAAALMGVAWGSAPTAKSAPAAHVHRQHNHIGFYRQHQHQPIALLRHLTMDRYLMARDTNVPFRMTGVFNAEFARAARVRGLTYTPSGINLAGTSAEAPPSLCEDCGGNHPVMYSPCARCQRGTHALCTGSWGDWFILCVCYCNPVRCFWTTA